MLSSSAPAFTRSAIFARPAFCAGVCRPPRWRRRSGTHWPTVHRYYAHWIADDTEVSRNVLNEVLANIQKDSEQSLASEV
jgi:hypothetical protein